MTLAVMSGTAVFSPPADAAITDPFDSRFSVNVNGSILIRGNTNMQCPAGAANCTAGRAGNNPNNVTEALNNNGYAMEYADTDGDPSTFNSSQSDITMPSGSTVLFAGLYWSADVTLGNNNTGAAATTPADKNKVRFGVPGVNGLTQITATEIFAPNTLNAYQGFADVTSMVAGAGNGVYRVADIQAGTGQDRYAGWALVIAYQNAAEPMHSLRVYDGFGTVNSNSTAVDITVSGFKAPSSGTVQAKIGTVVYEGDRGKTGDTLQLDTVPMTDAANPSNNFFNSTSSESGTEVTDRTPAWSNLMGVDIDQFNADGMIAHDATSAALKLTTTGETFYPGVVTFTTDLLAPKLVTTTTTTDLTGDPTKLVPGDTVEYRIAVRNDGTDTAQSTVLTDAIPTGMTYVPGSMKRAGATIPDSTTPVEFSLPNLAANADTYVTFRAKVNEGTAPNASIVNVPNVAYQGTTSNLTVKGVGDTSTLTVLRPDVDLVAGLTVTPSTVNRVSAPNTVDYTATARNTGADLEPQPVATVTLPTGVTPGVMPSNCSAAGQQVTCELSAVAPTTTGSVTFPASVDNSAADTASASVDLTGVGLDATPADNNATAVVTRNASPAAGANSSDNTTHATAVTFPVRASASDHEDVSSALIISVPTPPAHGTTVVNANGSITYTPNVGWRGAETFGYTVTDTNGATDTATITVTTANAAPVANPDSDSTASGVAVTVDVLANDTDPNGDTRTLVSVTQPQAGAGSTTVTSGQVVYTPTASFKGTATFTYVVSDGQGGTDTGTVTVVVSDGPPVAANDTGTVAYAGTVTLDVLLNDTDPNGDPITIDSVGQPSRGSAQITNGKIVYTAPAGFSGNATFTYTIKDSNGNTSTATVVVTVGNATPVAANLTPATATNTPLTLSPATASTDPNGDPLTVTGTTPAAHGTVVLNNNGTVTYTPAGGYTGPDSFTYTVSDGSASATGTVSLTVGNAAPTALADSFTVSSNAATPLDVLANDTDPNNDTLTITIDTPPTNGTAQVVSGKIVYKANNGFHGTDTFHYTVSDGNGGTSGASVSVVAVDVAPQASPDAATTGTDSAVSLNVLTNDSDPNGDVLTLLATTAPAHGTVTFTAAGVVTYTPATGFYGVDTFTYTVRDPGGNTAGAAITITVDNVAPNALDDRFPVKPGTATVLDVLANDTDPNTGQVLSVLQVGTAGKGTVTLAGGKVTYTPNQGATGTDTFTYVLTDDLGATDQATVTVVISGGPVINPDTATATAGAATEIDVLKNDTDPDGDTLTVVKVTDPAHGTVVLGADGKVRYTPALGYYGTDTFTYTVRDTAGNTATGTVTVTVGNAVPVAGADTAAVQMGKSVDIDVLANDTDANTDQKLTITKVGNPGHGTAELVTGKIRYTPAGDWSGTDTFTYEVSDGAGGNATGSVTVTVTGSKPVAVPDERKTSYQKAVTIEVLANDVDPDGSLALDAIGVPDNGTATADGDSVVFTPPAGFSGVATFSYSAQDATGQTTESTVKVTVTPAPIAPDKTVEAEPGEAISISLPTVDENGIAITVKALGKPKYGTATLNADGTVTYKAAKGFSGTDSFSYQAVDEDGNLTVGTITVTVAGAALSPVAVKDTYTVKAGETIEIQPTENDTDPYDDTLSIVKIGKPGHGAATLAGLVVTYVAAAGFTGTDTLSYTIQNEHGGTARATIVVRVTAAGAGDLPTTGAGIAPVFTVGLLTVVVGGVLFLLTMGNRPGRHRPGRHRN